MPSLEIKDYDLSAKNPVNIKQIIHRAPNEIMEDIIRTNEIIFAELVSFAL